MSRVFRTETEKILDYRGIFRLDPTNGKMAANGRLAEPNQINVLPRHDDIIDLTKRVID